MKSTCLLTNICLSAVLFCSCQKEIESIPSGSDSSVINSTLVKKYTEDIYTNDSADGHNIDSFALSYDDKDRLLSIVSLKPLSGNKYLYQYITDNSFTMDLIDNNIISIHEIFYLNSFSLVDSTLQYNDSHDTSTEKYTYNTARQLVQVDEYNYSGGSPVLSSSIYLEYDNRGNLVRETSGTEVTTYTYSSQTINNLNLGFAYFPKGKYLPDSVSYSSDTDSETATHTYAFDDQNRLIMDNTEFDSGIIVTKTYSY